MNWKRLTLALLLAGGSLASAAPVDDAARMDQVVRHFVDTQQFMGAVLVARGDEIVFDKAYGHAGRGAVPDMQNQQFSATAMPRVSVRIPRMPVLHVRHRSRSSDLKQLGVPQRDIEIITVENPKRFFSRS